MVRFVSALADRWGCSQGPCCVEQGEMVCAGSFFSGAEAVVVGPQCSPWAHGTASRLAELRTVMDKPMLYYVPYPLPPLN